MRKTRRFLTGILALTFFCGIADGMKPLEVLIIVLESGMVIIAAVIEINRGGKNDED